LCSVSTAVSTGEHTIKVTSTGGGTNLLGIQIDAGATTTIALAGASVPDNANNITIGSNMSYIDYLKWTVSGTEVIEYQPNYLIGSTAYSTGTATFTQGSDAVVGIGTAFSKSLIGGLIKPTVDTAYYTVKSVTDITHLTVDRNYAPATATGVAYGIVADKIQDLDNYTYIGAITWGTNSTLSIESYESTSAVSSTGTGVNVNDANMPSTWFGGGDITDLPFYDSFSQVSSQTGQPVNVIYFLGIVGLAIGILLLLTTTTRSALLGAVGFNIVFFIGSSMNIVPMWIPFSILIVQVGIIFLYRELAT
jgi:hypothetical protein